jgi:hypothetical protein
MSSRRARYAWSSNKARRSVRSLAPSAVDAGCGANSIPRTYSAHATAAELATHDASTGIRYVSTVSGVKYTRPLFRSIGQPRWAAQGRGGVSAGGL